jgi:hypothetical protein
MAEIGTEATTVGDEIHRALQRIDEAEGALKDVTLAGMNDVADRMSAIGRTNDLRGFLFGMYGLRIAMTYDAKTPLEHRYDADEALFDERNVRSVFGNRMPPREAGLPYRLHVYTAQDLRANSAVDVRRHHKSAVRYEILKEAAGRYYGRVVVPSRSLVANWLHDEPSVSEQTYIVRKVHRDADSMEPYGDPVEGGHTAFGESLADWSKGSHIDRRVMILRNIALAESILNTKRPTASET